MTGPRAVLAGLVACWIGVPGAAAQDQAASLVPPPPWRVSFDGQPSLRIGRSLRIDVHVSVQGRRDDHPDESAADSGFGWGQRRVGIEGRLFDRVVFQVERAIDDRSAPWRDVFADVRWHRALQTRAGRFKIPFGRETLTSITALDFINRSQVSEQLTPARDTGLAVHGAVWRKALMYDAGVFAHDGDHARDRTRVGSGVTAAGRITVRPFGTRDTPRWWQAAELGFAATRSRVEAGRNSMRIETVSGFNAVTALDVAGTRVRWGADAALTHGPVGVRAEVITLVDQRRAQGMADRDLAPLRATGWYLSATWMVTGEPKKGRIRPRRPLHRGGFGAFEVGGRLEALGMSSGPGDVPAFRNPRAEHVLANDYRAVTSGITWWPERMVRVQANLVVETLSDAQRSPAAGTPWFVARLVQVQLAF